MKYDPAESIVARFMAHFDTRLDTVALEARAADAQAGRIVHADPIRNWTDFGFQRTMAAWRAHIDRDDDLQQMIEDIRASDMTFIDSERDFDPGFGPYDGNDDKYLAYVLDWAGPMYADDETGTTEWDVHVMRFGRVLLLSDDQGFKDAQVYATEREARNQFDYIDLQYSKWDEQEAMA